MSLKAQYASVTEAKAKIDQFVDLIGISVGFKAPKQSYGTGTLIPICYRIYEDIFANLCYFYYKIFKLRLNYATSLLQFTRIDLQFGYFDQMRNLCLRRWTLAKLSLYLNISR